MPYFRICCTLIACFLLSGCFQTETLIRLKADGSGVIEEKLLLSKEMLKSLQEMAEAFQEEGDKKKDEGAKKKEDPLQGMIRDAQKKEGQYGPGVKFVSAVPLTTETMSGYKAIYAFKDINTLKITQNPGKKVDKMGGGQGAAVPEENILFSLKKGPVSTLTITLPKGKEEKKPASPKKEPKETGLVDPKALEQMKQIFKDMGFKVALEVEGQIIKTNATYRNKSEITLMELHFGKLIEKPEKFEQLAAAKPKTMTEAKELLKGIEGLKIETADPVVVEFK
ncbi:MAG: hypothetical protein AB1585_18470 [Thermodesulfobacteriota bacterium]